MKKDCPKLQQSNLALPAQSAVYPTPPAQPKTTPGPSSSRASAAPQPPNRGDNRTRGGPARLYAATQPGTATTPEWTVGEYGGTNDQ